jgi:hypothetical protein
MSDTYEILDGEEFELASPTNARVKELSRLELRAPNRGDLAGRKQLAREMGWDPTDVIPGYTRTETVERNGEEKEIERSNDLDQLTLLEYITEAAEVVCEGVDNLNEDDVRMDEARVAIGDFTNAAFGMSAGFETS